MINKRIAALREIMQRHGLEAFIITGSDPHNSEYLSDSWKTREWITGFTGSAGSVIITMNHAGLWTDSRYFIQAEQQLQGTEVQLHKLTQTGGLEYPEWIVNNVKAGSRIGIDGFCCTETNCRIILDVFEKGNYSLVEFPDPFGEIWLDRPALSHNKIFLLDDAIAGESVISKLSRVRAQISKNNAQGIAFSTLDDIAWLFNIRGLDIPYNQVVTAYAYVDLDKAYLFIRPLLHTKELMQAMAQNGVEVMDYHHFPLFLGELPKENVVCCDPNLTSSAIYKKIERRNSIVDAKSPVVAFKAIKNAIEIEGFKKAHLQDGVAMTNFFYWLEHHIGKTTITETEAGEKMREMRGQQPDYLFDSFGEISAYGANAALPHYSATPGADAVLEPKGLYLLDSGGQYTCGTTDITRTMALGPVTEDEAIDYTLVLKGMIALSEINIPEGTYGFQIDILARQFLWQNCKNYGHGTGHGIGHCLNVHEGPQSIRLRPLVYEQIYPGIVTSDEPGFYVEGSHGIRHENMILSKIVADNEYGKWIGFETLTLCYFDIRPLRLSLLSEQEIQWINTYHQHVYATLAPYLNKEVAEWLKLKTAPLCK